jgi:hypothetical protein
MQSCEGNERLTVLVLANSHILPPLHTLLISPTPGNQGASPHAFLIKLSARVTTDRVVMLVRKSALMT